MPVRLITCVSIVVAVGITLTVGCHKPAAPTLALQSQPLCDAPTPEPPKLLPPLPAETNLQRCAHHLECRRGSFCRDRGDTVKLCMGYGLLGAYCTDTVDCDEGLLCKRRSATFRVCM